MEYWNVQFKRVTAARERPVEAPPAQGHTVPLVFAGSETRMSPHHTEKPRKWQALAFSWWGQVPGIFYGKVTETQSEASHLAGRQRWLRKRTEIITAGLLQPWQQWQWKCLSSLMDSDDSGKFYLKHEIVKASPKKNDGRNTSSKWYRNASETAYSLPKENNQFSLDWIEILNRPSLIQYPQSSCENVIKKVGMEN